ncbi:MAG: hypothetical protein IJ123_06800 [Blautia sp.]|nr:hypothetical protein [Blautia sp.]
MTDSLNNSLQVWQMYWGESYMGWLVIICFIIAAVFAFRNHRLIPAVSVTAFLAAVFFLPVTENIMTKISEESVYWRYLWVIPGFLIVGLAFTCLIKLLPKTWMRIPAICAAAAVIAFCARGQSVGSFYEKPANIEKVPGVVASVADLILSEEADNYCVATDDFIASYLRVYAPEIKMLYGRRGDGNQSRDAFHAYQLLAMPELYMDVIPVVARNAGATHIIVRAGIEKGDEMMAQAGWSKLADVEDYSIFKDTGVTTVSDGTVTG